MAQRTVTASDLTERVTIQRSSVVRDDYNAEVVSWADVATVFARVVERGGREPILADRPVMLVSYEVVIRTGWAVTHQDRLVWRGKTLTVDTATPLPTGFQTLRCLEALI